ncbi:MAG TPA: PIG-L deacetylase family protein [Pseudonocardiaceae bacterium]
MRMLVVGSHPDDIELGAGALVAKAVSHGLHISFLILTDGPDRATRRSEALAAAAVLGVPAGRVFFAGLADGHLRADGAAVARVRELLAQGDVDPDVVVTHSQADSHNDHVEAHRISHAVFRNRVFLHYSIHLSGELDRFAPRVFVEVSGERLTTKSEALARHRSQRVRIEKADLAEYEAAIGRLAGLERAEGFEVGFQANTNGVAGKTIALSDSPFHRFWTPVVGDGDVTLLYEAYSAPGATIDWPTIHENAGRDRLRQAFGTQWAPRPPLHEKFSNSPDAADIVRGGNVILAGGAVSNPVVRDIYNRFRDTRWAIEYDLPRAEPAYLLDRADGRRRYPEFTADRTLATDVGLLALVGNPYAPGSHVVCAAGATGFGTRVGLEFLAGPGARPGLAALFEGPPGTQVAFRVDAATGELEIIDVHHGGRDVNGRVAT